MKILLAVTTHWPGPAPAILEATWRAAERSGADEARVITVGSPSDIPGAIHAGPNPGHQAGERLLVLAALAEAERLGCDWLVKCAGDCIHSGAGWARAWCDAARGMEATVIGDRWPEKHNWVDTRNCTERLRVMPQTKVFAASTKFLRATWPLIDSGFLERDFEFGIQEGGWWPLVRLLAGDEVDAYGEGNQQVWLPKSGPLRFRHCHSANELPQTG